jgi:hypothetical protein
MLDVVNLCSSFSIALLATTNATAPAIRTSHTVAEMVIGTAKRIADPATRVLLVINERRKCCLLIFAASADRATLKLDRSGSAGGGPSCLHSINLCPNLREVEFSVFGDAYSINGSKD